MPIVFPGSGMPQTKQGCGDGGGGGVHVVSGGWSTDGGCGCLGALVAAWPPVTFASSAVSSVVIVVLLDEVTGARAVGVPSDRAARPVFSRRQPSCEMHPERTARRAGMHITRTPRRDLAPQAKLSQRPAATPRQASWPGGATGTPGLIDDAFGRVTR
jgi:hypothetical protein